MNDRLTTLLTIVILVGVATTAKANAGQITMSNPQQETSEDGKPGVKSAEPDDV